MQGRYLLTQAYPGIATISTGANPSIHGIISDSWFSRVNGRVVDAVADEKTTTTGGRASPAVGPRQKILLPALWVMKFA